MSHRVLLRTALLTSLLLSFLLSFPLHAQTKKVLFDASHAQMVGNADWVVDEDVCGSPQRFPTPAQSGITSSTPETYWSGGYSAFGVDLAKAGYQIETLPPGVAVTYGTTAAQDLSNYNVFIIPEPNVRLTTAEKSAIVAFVQHGGGLFMISDHSGSDRNNDGWDSPMIFNDLGADTLFGIHFQVANEANDNIVDHPDVNFTADPSSVIVRTGPAGVPSKGLGLFNGTTFVLNTTVNASAKGHIWMTGGVPDSASGVTFATASYGSGRVAAIGDSSPSEDATNSCGHTTYLGWNDTTYDNAKVHLNAIAWLAGAGASCTDTTPPAATVTAPTATTVSGSVTISATGTDNVGVTGMKLVIDGTQVATSTTSAIAYTWNTSGLAGGSSHTIAATATDACGNVSPAATKTVTIATTVAYSISGNAGTTSATVVAGANSATSDASGNYSINLGGANGTYTVTPSKSGCTFSPASQSVTITSANVTGVNFTAACTPTTTTITNGTFETGSLTGWASAGVSSVIGTGAHGGTYAAQLGSTAASTDSSLAQTFTMPTNAVSLSFWVKITCPDTISYDWATATLKDNVSGTTTTLLAKTCSNTGAWQQVATPSLSPMFGHSVTLTLANHDDNYSGDATYSAWDDVVLSTETAGFTISGAVTSAGAGVGGATVVAGSTSVTTAASGTYTTPILPPGTYTVTPSKSGCTFTPSSQSITLSGANTTGVNFTASCVIVEPVLLDGFESGGWSTAQVSGTAGAFTIVTSSAHPSVAAHGGTHWADFNSYTSASGSQTRLYHTAPLSLAGATTNATLTFWMYHDTGYSTYADKVQVQVSTSGTSWTNVGAAVNRYNGATGWAQATIDLSAYKGQTIYLGFLGVSAYGNDEYLDDVLLTVK